ncbi:hypothetical protein [Xanthomonas theicola]|uniref:hypothetical protein n=1 Tax=Xanthomonas theicola TaxID=56464 RepID=UPI0036DB2DEB
MHDSFPAPDFDLRMSTGQCRSWKEEASAHKRQLLVEVVPNLRAMEDEQIQAGYEDQCCALSELSADRPAWEVVEHLLPAGCEQAACDCRAMMYPPWQHHLGVGVVEGAAHPSARRLLAA